MRQPWDINDKGTNMQASTSMEREIRLSAWE